MSTQYSSKNSAQSEGGLTPVQIGLGVTALILVVLAAVLLFRSVNNPAQMGTDTIAAHIKAKADNPNLSYVGSTAPSAATSVQPGAPPPGAPAFGGQPGANAHSSYH